MSEPKRVGEVLGALLARYRIGEVSAKRELESAFRRVAEAKYEKYCRLGVFKRGTLEIFVNNPVALQELSMFHSKTLADQMNKELRSVSLKQIKFRRG